MGLYKGPCDRCGKYLEKRVNPGRKRYHIECAIEVQTEQQLGYANGSHPSLAKSEAAGRETGQLIKERKGEAYTRWVGGMLRHLEAEEPTE